MILKGSKKIFMITLFCLIFHLSSSSQTHNYFIISGSIGSACMPDDISTIEIIKLNKKPVKAKIPSNGRFRLELEFNTQYQLIFNCKNHLTKQINVNTSIPEELQEKTEDFSRFLMGIQLIEANMDSIVLYGQNPPLEISFSTEKKCFVKNPTIFDIQYVDKGNFNQNQALKPNEIKPRLQGYAYF